MSAANGIISVKPVSFCAAVFWERGYWSEATHQWDWVRAETPLDEKPWAEFEVSLDVTLGAKLLGAACDAWGIEAGPIFSITADAREPVRPLRIRPAGAGRRWRRCPRRYQWPWTLPVAREDGTVTQISAGEITYRELLAASELGLIEGDVRRPYVHPVIPQGGAGALIEAGRLTLEAIRAAYGTVDDSVGYAEHTLRLIRASLPEAHRVIDEAIDEGERAAIDIRKIENGAPFINTQVDKEEWRSHLPKMAYKDTLRCEKKLRALGDLQFGVLPQDAPEQSLRDHLEKFLEIYARQWRGE